MKFTVTLLVGITNLCSVQSKTSNPGNFLCNLDKDKPQGTCTLKRIDRGEVTYFFNKANSMGNNQFSCVHGVTVNGAYPTGVDCCRKDQIKPVAPTGGGGVNSKGVDDTTYKKLCSDANFKVDNSE
ncbi:hypothetical protein PTTG_26097 [Puccinia triticina 1-1 BBBD Race 1]|uniref:Secreted protein n=1 Tax=Puccinia triticina (isolate 1-1 / race 1 (BBBD)) TaxID=630390 RepID=A0A180GZ14_PUCT1|nr:hypothetical protein PTTG_26097 [Puccinia triticina 1-1 BBBD Race 1]